MNSNKVRYPLNHVHLSETERMLLLKALAHYQGLGNSSGPKTTEQNLQERLKTWPTAETLNTYALHLEKKGIAIGAGFGLVKTSGPDEWHDYMDTNNDVPTYDPQRPYILITGEHYTYAADAAYALASEGEAWQLAIDIVEGKHN